MLTFEPNCGVSSLVAMTVSGNWWGAASGPGADPADLACDTTVDPLLATVPFKVKVLC